MRLFKTEIEDEYAQDNFITLEQFINEDPFLSGQFKFFEVQLASASYPATVSFKHNLGFLPKDIFVSSAISSGSYSIDYSKTDKNYIYVNITAPITLRAFLGTHK